MTSSRYDPVANVCIAQDHRPAEWRDVDPLSLTGFQRALLSIDGTVTKFIESHEMEPVDVHVIGQERIILEKKDRWLDAEIGESVSAREVILQGAQSGKLYAYALSRLAVHRIPEEVKEGLKQHPGGLGKVLLKSQLENRREVLWYGQESMKDTPDPIRHLTDGKFVSRTYRIIAAHKPLMVITEKFPLA